MAQVARYHRKSPPRDKHADYAALDPDDQHRVYVLAGLLRIGIALDRTYRRAVEKVRVELEDDTARIMITTSPDTDIELELFTARDRAGLLADALDKKIVFEVHEEAGRGAAGHPSASDGAQ
jgi:exopolyphosphatase/guanosine-5'-triphosphate,3'-diphosphate pyrophosphatase